MKKPTIIAVILTLIIILILGVFELFPTYSFVIKSNWDIDLPIKAVLTEIYEKDSETSFHGDGVRYHIFSYKYEDYIDLMFAWSAAEHETLHYGSVSKAADAWLDEIEVPENMWPDYGVCGSWHRSKEYNSEIILFWDSERNLLNVIENFFNIIVFKSHICTSKLTHKANHNKCVANPECVCEF